MLKYYMIEIGNMQIFNLGRPGPSCIHCFLPKSWVRLHSSHAHRVWSTKLRTGMINIISKKNKEFNIVILADDYIYIHFTNVLKKNVEKKCRTWPTKTWFLGLPGTVIFGIISLVLVNEKGKLQNFQDCINFSQKTLSRPQGRAQFRRWSIAVCGRPLSVSDLLRHICPLLEFPQLSERCSQNLPTLINLVLKR